MTRFTRSTCGLMVCLLLTAMASSAQGADPDRSSFRSKQRRRTLADRIPAVSDRKFSKAGRLEIGPLFGLSLNDPFYRHLPIGAHVAFHLAESLHIGAGGVLYLSNGTDVPISGGAQQPRPDYNRPKVNAWLEAAWAPLYGKLSLFAETILHFDTYLGAFVGIVKPEQTSQELAFGAVLGQRYVVTDWFALKVELREQLYRMVRNPVASTKKDRQYALTGYVGVCFYLFGRSPEPM